MRNMGLIAIVLLACATEPEEETDVGEDCPAIYEPVCADGTTYENECLAIEAGETDITEGACEE